MADDIVTRLRAWSKEAPTLGQAFDLLHVADEIERLRAEVNSMASAQAGWGRVARLNDEVERLRAAGDALVEALRGWCDGMDAFEEDQDRVRAWLEARRG